MDLDKLIVELQMLREKASKWDEVQVFEEKARKWDDLQERIVQARDLHCRASIAARGDDAKPIDTLYLAGIANTLNILGIIDLDN